MLHRTWLLPSLRSNVSGSILHVEASRRGRVRLNPSCFSGSGADRRGERRKCRPWRFAPLRQPLDLLNLPIKPRLLTALSQERVIGLRLRALRHQRQLSLEVPAERSDVIRRGRTCGRLRLAAKSIKRDRQVAGVRAHASRSAAATCQAFSATGGRVRKRGSVVIWNQSVRHASCPALQ
jgi:hypothetical protein